MDKKNDKYENPNANFLKPKLTIYLYLNKNNNIETVIKLFSFLYSNEAN